MHERNNILYFGGDDGGDGGDDDDDDGDDGDGDDGDNDGDDCDDDDGSTSHPTKQNKMFNLLRVPAGLLRK
jgi:hypothetical protein